ncbi:dromaiocalcin-1-like isoform X2 [Carettochelys insculpta]|uniref:dromaiocalcin-1-like isoform X2 n=1 Tax=Carettochelys insculpta TaxID=44489 RepID=UPI003EB8328B
MDRGSEKMGPVACFSLCLLGCLVCSPSLAAENLPGPVEPAAPSAASQGPVAERCREGWRHFFEGCYGYFSHEKTWEEAEIECQQCWSDAHLASIHSAEEERMIADYVKQMNENKRPVWIGFLDRDKNQCWSWTDESQINYTAWDQGQPDSPEKKEHCLVLERPEFKKWHNYSCGDKFPFLCKHSAQGRRLPEAGGSQLLGSE